MAKMAPVQNATSCVKEIQLTIVEESCRILCMQVTNFFHKMFLFVLSHCLSIMVRVANRTDFPSIVSKFWSAFRERRRDVRGHCSVPRKSECSKFRKLIHKKDVTANCVLRIIKIKNSSTPSVIGNFYFKNS